MNANAKGFAIGGVAGAATYAGDIVQWLIEMRIGDMPDRIDTAITGLTVAIVGYIFYRLLPSSSTPAE